MIESEVAQTLMSLSAPDERKFADNPLYAAEPPSAWHASKKRAFAAFDAGVASSLPSSSFLQPRGDGYSSSMSLLQHKIQGRPLTSMIPGREDADSSSSDVDMDSSEASDEAPERPAWSAYRSPFDGLVAAAASNQDDNDSYSSSNSRPISIPMRGGVSSSSSMRYREHSSSFDRTYSSSYGKKHKPSSLSRVQEDESFLGRDCSPTGVEEEDTWYDSDYKQRMRLASVCSSEGSEYGGLGRQHLEEFIRMEISAANESEQHREGSSPSSEGKYIGSYSPEARRKRIERFLEKRKRRVWAKKVDYDVRKNFANSRLRVKGRFVKKEDEELLCQLLSYT
ncbi:CCT domain [Phytophthora cinnamomi]|uniref:CCT domain n=1 Tax=Phytophthora cinnamomi TaxID=4785 RepID=UPI003559E13E|nr:CCT domain [Phytophthora cinnamomi]KAG6582800.1 CCT domain [Phytophthora cinnamomi]